jgi:hypothetical protein
MGCIETESLPLCYEYVEINSQNYNQLYNILFILHVVSLILLNYILFYGFR